MVSISDYLLPPCSLVAENNSFNTYQLPHAYTTNLRNIRNNSLCCLLLVSHSRDILTFKALMLYPDRTLGGICMNV